MGSCTSAFCFFRSAAAAAMHSCVVMWEALCAALRQAQHAVHGRLYTAGITSCVWPRHASTRDLMSQGCSSSSALGFAICAASTVASWHREKTQGSPQTA